MSNVDGQPYSLWTISGNGARREWIVRSRPKDRLLRYAGSAVILKGLITLH
jgi:hypothetical protein